MHGKLLLGVVAGWAGLAGAAHGQVVVQAPFVNVQVGPGVTVNTPFVSLFFPPRRAVCCGPAAPYVGAPLAPQILPPPAPLPPGVPGPAAPVVPAPVGAPTLEEFSRSFQPRGGTYEVALQNPVTGQPTPVRFTLPDGPPRRVIVNRRQLEFVYGPRQFVRIGFDRGGAQVTAR